MIRVNCPGRNEDVLEGHLSLNLWEACNNAPPKVEDFPRNSILREENGFLRLGDFI